MYDLEELRVLLFRIARRNFDKNVTNLIGTQTIFFFGEKHSQLEPNAEKLG